MGVVGIEYDGITNDVEVVHLSFGDGVEYVPHVEPASGVMGLLGFDGEWVGGVEGPADEGVELRLRPRLFVACCWGVGCTSIGMFLTTGLEKGSLFFPRAFVVVVDHQLWKRFFRGHGLGVGRDGFFDARVKCTLKIFSRHAPQVTRSPHITSS